MSQGTWETPEMIAAAIQRFADRMRGWPGASGLRSGPRATVAWRRMAADWRRDPSAQVFVVFIADFSDDGTGPYDKALRRQIQSGERSAEIHATEHN